MADTDQRSLRIAAAGDVHCREANREAVVGSFARLEEIADVALVAGDLTSLGTVAEAEVLVEAAAATAVPVFAVLGNHDWEGGEAAAMIDALRAGGVRLLEGEHAVLEVDGVELGIVGVKGYVGGFAPHQMPDFGEPGLKALYAETGAEVAALDAGLRAIATCPLRVVLLHYSPAAATLEGEPPEIFAFLGSDRLAAPILEHGPDLVLHGHAHAGAPEGRIGEVPVRNVSIPVIGTDWWTTELRASAAGPIP
ncbi:MAG TPA: metallophosphoesterase [Solirubrobacterales bacterium]|nr:metallophosphoesterase [Solirubrobacterales bacterium]